MERLTIDEIIEHCNRKTEMYEKACDVKYLETAVMGNVFDNPELLESEKK